MKYFLFLFLALTLSAEIVQIKHIEECKNHVQPGMLLVFDVDNTLMETAQLLGSDQWFSYRIQENINRGLADQEALAITLAEWVAIQNNTQVKPAEPSTAGFIQSLQNNGWAVMGLTTRGIELSTRTREQLQSIGIDFAKASPAKQDIGFKNIPGAVYRKGVLFSTGTSKGSLLFQFFKETGYLPKKILFVDDKEKYLRDVERCCNERGIPFIGLRYGFLDEKVKNLRPELAAVQLKRFGCLISDEEAEAQLIHKLPEKSRE
jgi:hypothetical protein